MVCVYETDLDPVLDLLPPELTPLNDPPQIICVLNAGYEFGTGGGGYSEMAPLIPVLYNGEPHIYPWVVYLGEGTEEWFAAGREVLADGKKLGRISINRELGKGLIMGTLERPRGHRLVTQIIGPLDRQCDASEFDFYPVIGLRVIPSGEHEGGKPQIVELYRKEVVTTLKQASDGSPMIFSGPATIDLGRSEQDPLYKLPVNKVVAGYYVEFGTIDQFAGEVVKRYA